jgi:hypothetical protein
MRCFETDNGQMLAEWARSDTDVLKPDRTPLGQASTFYLLDAAGAIDRTWTTTVSSLQEHLTTLAYVVEDEALVCYLDDLAFGFSGATRTLKRSVELEGLRLLPPERAPSKELVQAAIDRYDAGRREAWAEHERHEAERLARFERALPPLAAEERITLVWRYDGPDVVIARATGEEVWCETDWPWMGKGLYRRLAHVAARRYGDQLEAFEGDVPADEYLRFDHD